MYEVLFQLVVVEHKSLSHVHMDFIIGAMIKHRNFISTLMLSLFSNTAISRKTRSNSLRSMIWVFMEISHERKLVVFGNANRICINIFLVGLAKYSSVILFKYTSHPEHFLYICRKSRNVNFKTLCLLTFYWMKFLWVFWDRMYNT